MRARLAPTFYVAVTLGCGGDSSGPVTTPNPSPAELALLGGAAQAFIVAASDLPAARAAALGVLGADPLVAEAELLSDGTSLPVTFTSGALAGINTRVPTPDDLTPEELAAWRARLPTGAPRRRVEVVAAALSAPKSHKVLLVAGATAQTGGADLAALEEARDHLIESDCYEPEDIVIKANLAESGYADLTAADLLELEGYGLVIINTPSTLFEREGANGMFEVPYIQLGARDELATSDIHHRLVEVPVPETGEHRTYEYLDLGVWALDARVDEGAIIVMSTANADYVDRSTIGLGAREDITRPGAYLGWSGDAALSGGAATSILPWFLASDHGDDGSVTRSIAAWEEWNDLWDDELELPFADVVEGDVGMPTWADISTSDWPEGTVTVRTSVRYEDTTIPPTDPVEDVKHSPNTIDGLVPGTPAIVTAEAIDVAGNVIATAESEVTFDSGGCNDVVVRFAEEAITMLVSPQVMSAHDVRDVTVQVASWRWDDDDDAWVAAPGAAIELTTDRGTWVGSIEDDVIVVTTDEGAVASATLQTGDSVGTVHITAKKDELVAHAEVRIVDAVYLEDFEDPPGAEWSSAKRTLGPTGYYLGTFTTEEVVLSLSDLPQHGTVIVTVDVVLTGTWYGGALEGSASAADWPTHPPSSPWGHLCAFAEAGSVETCEFRIENHYIDHLELRFGFDARGWDPESYTDPEKPYGPHWWGLDNVRAEIL
ncbi:MAG: hypothetical protein IT385_13190 [Deltaproteobacteria bacterium]|nr:hypothetical protein [Deltaproteobacteria bacterium]